jgi:hypothetical protein
LAAPAASGNGNPAAFAFPAQHNLSYALLAVSLIVVDAVVRSGAALQPMRSVAPVKATKAAIRRAELLASMFARLAGASSAIRRC